MGVHFMNKPVAILSCFAMLLIASACKPPEAAQRSTSSGTKTTVGTVDDGAGFWVKPCKKYEGSEDGGTCTAGNYLMHKQTSPMSYSGGGVANDASSNYNQECKVSSSAAGTAGGLINCTVEADELELVMNGISFAYNVPSSMCEYFGIDPFHFWNFKPGPTSGTPTNGPTTVSYTLTTDGKVVTGSITTGPVNNQATVNEAGTGARCLYDYSYLDPAGPNCCEGNYTLQVTQLLAGGGEPPR